MIIEMRTYRTKPGMRSQFLAVFGPSRSQNTRNSAWQYRGRFCRSKIGTPQAAQPISGREHPLHMDRDRGGSRAI